MAKTIKFNLICDEYPALTIEDLQNHFSVEDLLDYYVEMMPTPQEAVKDILKPKYGYHGGTLIMKHFNGSYECTSSKLILQNGAMQTIAAYTYNEADTMIRKLYRDGELCPERQDAK